MLKTGEERIIAVKVSRLHPPSYAVSFLLAYIVPVPDEQPQPWRVVQGDRAGGKGFVKSIPLLFPPPMPLIHWILAFFYSLPPAFPQAIPSLCKDFCLFGVSQHRRTPVSAPRFTPARRPCLLWFDVESTLPLLGRQVTSSLISRPQVFVIYKCAMSYLVTPSLRKFILQIDSDLRLHIWGLWPRGSGFGWHWGIWKSREEEKRRHQILPECVVIRRWKRTGRARVLECINQVYCDKKTQDKMHSFYFTFRLSKCRGLISLGVHAVTQQ